MLLPSATEPPSFSFPLDIVRSELLRALSECQCRGLVQSCKWLGDLLHTLETSETTQSSSATPFATPFSNLTAPHLSAYLFAKSLFDARDYDHCVDILRPFVPVGHAHAEKNDGHPPDSTSCPSLIYFLFIYASYMACERRRANDEVELRRVFEQDGSSKPSQVAHSRCKAELSSLRSQIESRLNVGSSNPIQSALLDETDPFVLYIFGLVYVRLGMESIAVSLFVKSINACSFIWPAWYELAQLVKNKEHLKGLNLPSGDNAWMYHFFEAKVFLKLNETERALNILQRLSESGFAASGNLQADIAVAYDNLRDMDSAAKQFEKLYLNHPCRLDNVDTYSNVLFVREDSIELANLAHHCVQLDKYRPETCCVVGNFFSLREQHEKAVLYFQRALKLKPSYSLVWTLVGHEYTEMRNTNAAVHAYRQAIAHNPHDYRAWYGLGQMYEIMDLPSFALYYYREAQYLIPTDSRLIVALGEIYERLERLDEAKKCYWRAYCVGDIEGNALVRLAFCFAKCGEMAEAAAAYTEFIKLSERNGVHSQVELAEAYKFLATFHLQLGHYEDSAAAASKCLEFRETREEAKDMLRQITALAGDVEVIAFENGDGEDNPPTDGTGLLSNDPKRSENKLMAQPPPNQMLWQMNEGKLETPAPSASNINLTPDVQPLDLSLGSLLVALGDARITSDTGAISRSSTAAQNPSSVPLANAGDLQLWDESTRTPGNGHFPHTPILPERQISTSVSNAPNHSVASRSDSDHALDNMEESMRLSDTD